mmetsp:Transcript_22787/g.53185  ORF Transcript_22787/g.53185 Transcript_22787/m.53185 type:complete len:200 (-) Transcript_22787:910-1509(-)
MLGSIVCLAHVPGASHAVGEKQGPSGFLAAVPGTAMWSPAIKQYHIAWLTSDWDKVHLGLGFRCDHSPLVERHILWPPHSRGYLQSTILFCGSIDCHHGRYVSITTKPKICRGVLVGCEPRSVRQFVVDLFLEEQSVFASDLAHHILEEVLGKLVHTLMVVNEVFRSAEDFALRSSFVHLPMENPLSISLWPPRDFLCP